MAGLDENTKLLMHMDGSDDGTTFPDSSITTPKGNASVTATVTTETTDPKWGTAAAQFDGDSGFLSYADSADWDIAGGAVTEWTIDLWAYHTNTASDNCFASHMASASPLDGWYFRSSGANSHFFVWTEGSQIIALASAGGISQDTWQHIAMYRNANIWSIYIAGVQKAYLDDASTDTFTSVLRVGSIKDGQYFVGKIDELRIQQGNPFGANPNATPDDTITVPTGPYGVDVAKPRQVLFISD